jgi:hypothetical protein
MWLNSWRSTRHCVKQIQTETLTRGFARSPRSANSKFGERRRGIGFFSRTNGLLQVEASEGFCFARRRARGRSITASTPRAQGSFERLSKSREALHWAGTKAAFAIFAYLCAIPITRLPTSIVAAVTAGRLDAAPGCASTLPIMVPRVEHNVLFAGLGERL